MILTCPDCATSYFVDDASVPPQGRTVKCTNCGSRWRAVAEADPESEPEIAIETPAPAPPPVVVEPPPPVIAAAADDFDIVVAPPRAAKPTKRTRGERRPSRAALYAGLGVAATLAIAAGAAVMFRDRVVEMAPPTAEAFAAIGLPAGHDGLLIQHVTSKAVFQGGRPVLAVTGQILNTASETVAAPSIRVSLLDKAGKPLAAKIAKPLNAGVPAGSRRYFAIAIADPPAGLSDLEVVFEDAAAHAAEPPAHTAETHEGPHGDV